MENPLRVGQFVTFNDNPECSGEVFEFQDDGAVAGLKNVSQKLIDMGIECVVALFVRRNI